MPAPAKTFKRTTIYISLGEHTQVYDSPDSIPLALRKKLMRSTRGMNSATILIADRGGRQEIQKILEGQPSSLDGTLRSSYFQPRAEAPPTLEAPAQAAPGTPSSAGAASFWRRAAELSLPAALGIALWLLFTLK
jgi:hypothetical protein